MQNATNRTRSVHCIYRIFAHQHQFWETGLLSDSWWSWFHALFMILDRLNYGKFLLTLFWRDIGLNISKKAMLQFQRIAAKLIRKNSMHFFSQKYHQLFLNVNAMLSYWYCELRLLQAISFLTFYFHFCWLFFLMMIQNVNSIRCKSLCWGK